MSEITSSKGEKSFTQAIEEFRKILEQPAEYCVAELVGMVFDSGGNSFSEIERELIERHTESLVTLEHQELARIAAATSWQVMKLRSIFANLLQTLYQRDKATAAEIDAVLSSESNQRQLTDLLKEELKMRAASARSRGRAAAEARFNKKGGSREAKAEILRIWQTGKYSSKDTCAEQEFAALGISFSTARKALRNA